MRFHSVLRFSLSESTAAFGFVVGFLTICSHVLADALTPAGVRPTAPYRNRRYSYGLVRASNPLANYALFVVGVIAVVGAALLGRTFAGLL